MIRNLLRNNIPILILTAVVILCLYTFFRAVKPFEPKQWQPYIVQSGDTIWDIANDHNVSGNIQDTVAIIRGENGINPNDLKPGMRIQVPVK